jgi:hypothetical protein
VPVKKQLHVFRLQPLPNGETTFQKHELIYLQPLRISSNVPNQNMSIDEQVHRLLVISKFF